MTPQRVFLWISILCGLRSEIDSFVPPFMPKHKGDATSLRLFWFGGKDEGSKNKGASSGFGGVAAVMDSMENFKKAQQVGKMTEMILQELSAMNVEGSAAEGKVRVFLDGNQLPKSVDIDEAYLSSVQADDLNAALAAAMRDAHVKSKEKMEDKMKSFYAELGVPQAVSGSS